MTRVALFFLTLAAPAVAFGDDAPSVRAALGSWPMERVRTKDGKIYRGLVQKENHREIEFAEIAREPGKEMYLVVRPIPRSDIAEIERLGANARRQLAGRIERFKHRSRIEAAELDDVVLTTARENGQEYFVYDSPDFLLRSTSSEATTRLAVVRLDQIFRAYRQALPPRTEPRRRIEAILHGSMEQYREYLAEHKLQIDHPAFFWADRNLIVAGADIDRYAEQLRKANEENQKVGKQYEALDREFEASQVDWSAKLKQQGMPADQIERELGARRSAWKRRYGAMLRKINAANRDNEKQFQEVKQQFFARLRHEAFHAYLESYLYPREQYDVPRWLNEGLAQVFERGLMDQDTLRLDAPDRGWLRRLQADLESGNRLGLADLLAASDAEFLALHGRADSTDRRYLYSWGLAWHLLFDRNLLGGETLTPYVEQNAAAAPPRQRFEQFLGQKLAEFEPEWIRAMLALRPPRG